jgi:glycosyltransferase involved in cell wall biosynthesis
MTPKVSVIIPTYNRADLLIQTLQSVVSQRYADFETLVVDDGSSDNTADVIAALGDSRIRYVRQAHSGLPAVGRNTGMQLANGEYIAFLDSDDLWLSDKLASQVELMDSHPELALSYTNCYRFKADPTRYHPVPMLQPQAMLSGHAFDQLYACQAIPNLTVMLRSSVRDEVGQFDEDPQLKANEDYEYWLRIAARFPIDHLPQPLALYREHAAGISKAAVATNQAKLYLIELLDQLYPRVAVRLQDKRRRWLAQVTYALGRAYLREQQVAEARQHFRRSWQSNPRLDTLVFWSASYLGRPVYERLDGLKTARRDA